MNYLTRTQVQDHYSDEFLKDILEKGRDLKGAVLNAVDGGYCYGYNIVLEAAMKVLPVDEYRKIVDKLEEWDAPLTD